MNGEYSIDMLIKIKSAGKDSGASVHDLGIYLIPGKRLGALFLNDDLTDGDFLVGCDPDKIDPAWKRGSI